MAHTRKPRTFSQLNPEMVFLETGYFSHCGKITRKIWFCSLNEKQWPAFPPDEELELAHMNPKKKMLETRQWEGHQIARSERLLRYKDYPYLSLV